MAYHMVFDNKKWYEGLMPNYIGKTIYTANIHSQLHFYILGDDDLEDKLVGEAKTVNGLEIIEQLVWKNIAYLRTDLHGSYIKASDIFKLGGVLASYMNTLCSTRKELVA